MLTANITDLKEQVILLKTKLELEQTNKKELVAISNNIQTENDNLRHQIKLLKQALFGKKSEKTSTISLDQLSMLFNEAEHTLDEAVPEDNEETEIETAEVLTTTKKKKGRKPLPKNLPRERIIHELPESALECMCGTKLDKIGEEISEELHYIPAKLLVREHVRYKYACKCCEENIKRAPAPFRVLDKCMASSGVLADILVKKYEDHLPLYRQSQIWKRHDIELSRSTLSNWVIGCANKLEPLIKILKEEIIKSNYVCSDETVLNVLSENSNSYMWVHLSGLRQNRSVVFEYNRSRSAMCVDNFMSDFKGYHQCDGYAGYNNLHSKSEVIGVGCMAHARRKFMEIVKIVKSHGVAHKVVSLMNELYVIEKKIYWHDPHIIQEKRQELSRPILEKLYELLIYNRDKTPPQGILSKAINYALNQWEKLTRYIENGELRIDNNDTEQIIKPFAIGRKNWMFSNTESGAKASSIIYSLIETCKANKINSYNYIKYVLDHIGYAESDEQLRSLLPYNLDQDLLKNFRRL